MGELGDPLFGVAIGVVRKQHPDWVIAGDDDTGYLALNKPTQTSEHVIAARTLRELSTRLDEVDGNG